LRIDREDVEELRREKLPAEEYENARGSKEEFSFQTRSSHGIVFPADNTKLFSVVRMFKETCEVRLNESRNVVEKLDLFDAEG